MPLKNMTSSQPVMDRVLPQVNYFTPFPYRMNPNIHTRGGYTPLHLSAMHKRDKVYQLLLQTYGADPDRRDYSGFKPQHYLTSSSDKVGEDYLLFDGLGGEDLPDIVNKMDDNSTVASEAAAVVPVYTYSSSSTNTKVDKNKGHFLRDFLRESKRKPPLPPNKPGPSSNIPI